MNTQALSTIKKLAPGGKGPKKPATTVKKSAPVPKKAAPAPKKAAPKTVKKAAPRRPPPSGDSPLREFGAKLPGGGTPGATTLLKEAPKGKPTAGAPTYAKPTPKNVKDSLSQWYGPSRKLYLPGGLLGPEDIPSYLDGSLAGDYGFDPLGLGQDKEQVEKYREYELIHARWAMLGAGGCFFADAAGKGNPFTIGKDVLDGTPLMWSAPPFVTVENPLPLPAILAIQVLLMGAVENYRTSGEGPAGFAPNFGEFEESVFAGKDKLNPGGPLDFFGLASDPDEFELLKVKEIKNGRLAMVTMLAFGFQGLATGEGPYQNWAKHVVDPFGYNLTTVLGNVGERTGPLAL